MSNIKVRVGQQNAVKIISSISGSSGGNAITAENVVGGIASVTQLSVSGLSSLTQLSVSGLSSLTQLSVSGLSTFVGITTFKNDVYIDGDLIIRDDLVFDEFTVRNGNITGILTMYGDLSFYEYNTYGILYFNSEGFIESTYSPSPESVINYTNYILTTDIDGIPNWSSTIDGGVY